LKAPRKKVIMAPLPPPFRYQRSAIGSHHNLDAAILFVAKPLIGLGAVFKTDAVRDQKGWVDLSF
jgi:hypothetical protein